MNADEDADDLDTEGGAMFVDEGDDGDDDGDLLNVGSLAEQKEAMERIETEEIAVSSCRSVVLVLVCCCCCCCCCCC